MDLIQKADLAATSFSNNDTSGAGGVAIRVDAGSVVGNAVAGLGSVTSGVVNPTAAPARVPAVHFNTANDTLWFWNGAAWEVSGRNYHYNAAKRETVSQVLTAADAGLCLILRPTVAGATIELPLYSAVPAGAIFDLVNVSSFAVTVLVSSGSADTIVAGLANGPTFTLNPQTSVRIARITGAPWHVLFGSQLSTAFGVAAGVPPGAISAFAQATAPAGWLKANGALVSRTTYAALFAEIGTTYGAGDGSTTFALPDLRGEFVRGWDDGRGVDTGRALGSSQADELKTHTHDRDYLLGGSTGSAVAVLAGANVGLVLPTRATGGDETRPRNVALLYCIKH